MQCVSLWHDLGSNRHGQEELSLPACSSWHACLILNISTILSSYLLPYHPSTYLSVLLYDIFIPLYCANTIVLSSACLFCLFTHAFSRLVCILCTLCPLTILPCLYRAHTYTYHAPCHFCCLHIPLHLPTYLTLFVTYIPHFTYLYTILLHCIALMCICGHLKHDRQRNQFCEAFLFLA